MQILVITKVLSMLLLFLTGALLLCVPFSIYYGDGDLSAFLISAGICLAIGLGGTLIRTKKSEVRPKEGFAIVTLGWVIFSAFGALPFVISGAIPNYTDAFFETMSGFTTTGASILTSIESLPHGILFWRSLTHWLGGMGIIVLTIAILPFLGIGGMQLFKAEVPGPVVDKLSPRIANTAKLLWLVYLILTVAEAILLLFGGMNLFDSLCHTFGTMATGGFSSKNTSIAHYASSYIEYVIIVFMILAGINFSLHFHWMRGNFKALRDNEELRFYLFLILVVTALIAADIYINNYSDIEQSIRLSLFQVVSIMTTTGYASTDYEQWSWAAQITLLAIMFIGGSAGSTGGGMKVVRILLLVKFSYTEIKKMLHPQAVYPVKLGRTVVDRSVLINIAGFFVLFTLISAVSAVAMAFLGLDIPTAISSVVATINNIGPGLGGIGPMDNYSFVPAPGKWLLSFLMLLGRLELFTVLILLAPSFWKK